MLIHAASVSRLMDFISNPLVWQLSTADHFQRIQRQESLIELKLVLLTRISSLHLSPFCFWEGSSHTKAQRPRSHKKSIPRQEQPKQSSLSPRFVNPLTEQALTLAVGTPVQVLPGQRVTPSAFPLLLRCHCRESTCNYMRRQEESD